MARTRRIILTAAALALAGCGTTRARFGVTGPAGGAPSSFTPAPTADEDTGVGAPGIPASGSAYLPSNRPAREAATPGSFCGYN
ncbi:MAG: hypothetical protein JSR21_10285 [Proteobacteria bacterium]|nr:hypothetical protein [Pseudomonadota bacterium]